MSIDAAILASSNSTCTGLRGAIAFALAAEYSEGEPRRIILTTTLVIVLATVLVNGSATTTVLELLRIR